MCGEPVVHLSLLIFCKLPFPFFISAWAFFPPHFVAGVFFPLLPPPSPPPLPPPARVGKPPRRGRLQTPSAHRHEAEVCESLSLIIGPRRTPTDLPTQRGVTAPVWYCLIIVADTKEAGGARDIRHSPSVRGPRGFWQSGQVIRKGQEGFIWLRLGAIARDWLIRELNKSAVKVIVDGREVVIRIKIFPSEFF